MPQDMAPALADQTLHAPLIAMMLLTLLVWLYMYARRLPFLRSLHIDDLQRLTIPGELARLSPPAVNNPSENLKNLFEMPVLFYALALYLEQVGQTDSAHLAAAWTFVAFRALHSLVQCTSNYIPLRFALYLISSLALASMIVRAAIALVTG